MKALLAFAAAAVALTCATACPYLASAQTAAPNPSAQRLLAARSLYYTPTAKGLQSFHCDVTTDWKAMLTRFSSSAIADDNAFLVYLRSARLAASDDLRGEGKIEWADTTTAPAALTTNAKQMHDGMVEMMGGYFKFWNPFMNGGMVPFPDNTMTITPNGDGVHFNASSATAVVDNEFDRNMLLISSHVVTKELDNTAYPIYEATSDGLRISTIRNILHNPPTGPAQEVTAAMTYAPVGGFQLPSTVRISVSNVGYFDFSFTNCSVKTAAPAAVK